MFKKFFEALYKYKLAVLLFILFGFILGFFITEFVVNNNYSYYQFEINAVTEPNDYFNNDYFASQYEKIEEYNLKIKNNEISGSKIYTTTVVDITKLGDKIKLEKIDDNTYLVKISRKYFPTTFVASSMKLNLGITKAEKQMKAIFDSGVEGIDCDCITMTSNVYEAGYINPYKAGIITSAVFVLFFIIIILAIVIKNKDIEIKDISDGEEIFKNPFNRKYWVLSSKCFKKVKNLAVMAILFALMMCCKAIAMPSGFGALGLSLTYLFFAIIAMLYGPLAGIVIGLFSDILGFILFPDGQMFFLGYTIDAMLAGFTYGIMLYRTKITFAKCLYARIIVNIFVNVILGSMWWAIINSFTFDAYVTYTVMISLPKNLIYLLPQSIALFLVLKSVVKPIKSFDLMDYRICENISLL